MILKLSFNVIKGMRLDVSPSKANPEYIFDAKNIRLTARGNDTLLSISNELSSVDTGIVLTGLAGYCIFNDYIVAFCRYSIKGDISEYIERISLNADNLLVGEIIYSSWDVESSNKYLNFNNNMLTLGIYENENILKVYWVDGVNLPRVINIVKDKLLNVSLDTLRKSYNANSFDFVPELLLKEEVKVSTILGGNGRFSSGTILYAFTYYNKYGLESNIFYVSDLNYVTFPDRGGSAENLITNAFKISINTLDHKFNYLRIYSIHRTSIDATPEVKKIIDINIEDTDTINYIDNNSLGESVDPTFLLYVGGEDITATTLSQKDNTLFLGNLSLKKPVIPLNIKDNLLTLGLNIKTSYRKIRCQSNIGSFYRYSNLLVADNTCTFKNREHYRLGVLFQYKNGKWSEPVVTNYAYTVNLKPSVTDGGTLETEDIDIYRLPKLTLTINKDIANKLIDLGFRKVRTLVVNPSLQDRKVILQGMVCPTVYNKKSRESESPYSLSSWFLRPYIGSEEITKDLRETYDIDSKTSTTLSLTKINMGANIRCAHGYSLLNLRWSLAPQTSGGTFAPYLISRGVEIESSSNASDASDFAVDLNIVTLHSPDIEFDNSIATLGGAEFKCRFVGYIPFISNTGDISILTSSPPIGDKSTGFYHKTLTVKNSLYAGRSLVSGLFYKDFVVDDSGDADKYKQHPKLTYEYSWMVYPWQCSGSLNNDVNRPANSGTRSAVLKRKVISNLKYGADTRWFTTNDVINGTTGSDVINQDIYPILIFNSNEVTLTKINLHNYYGNINTLIMSEELVTKKVGVGLSANAKYLGWNPFGDDSRLYKNENTESTFYDDCILTMTLANKFSFKGDIADLDTKLIELKSSVSMKYKSTPHIVMLFTNGKLTPMFINNTTSKTIFSANRPVDSITSSKYNTIVGYPLLSYLFMAELYRDNVENPFGGNSIDAIKSNLWIPSGTAVPLYLENLDSGGQVNTDVEYLHGDCYYLRYDCLKTYPFTNEDENSIVEIGSFMVETRVNIDGRYDRNRGLISNLNISPLNFNLINNIYTLKDNFFNYRILDADLYKLNSFPNSITWSKEKTSAEEVDTWTNITMANTFDVDGNLGEVISIENYNNELYCFLDKGISRILFNNRVLIPTGDNIPIEISNGYKVLGKVYLSNTVGCLNLKAIKVTPNGIYFSDLNNSGIYLLSQLGMLDISTPRGFTNWVKNYLPNEIYYDAANGDLYIIGKVYGDKLCICFSEKLNEFTSFMDYDFTYGMFNFNEDFYSCHAGTGLLYKLFSGDDYNKLLGTITPYHITYIANQNPTNDKIFNTIEFRGDSLNTNDKLIKGTDTKMPNICPFNKLTVWNEYLKGEETLNRIYGRPSNLKEKFRTWRANIPRDESNHRDRIRNPWAYIKLEGSNNTNRMLLHDLLVYYFDNSIIPLR